MGATQSIIGAKFFQKKQEETAAPVEPIVENVINQPNATGELNLGNKDEDLDLELDFERTSNAKVEQPPVAEDLIIQNNAEEKVDTAGALEKIVKELDDGTINEDNVDAAYDNVGETCLHLAAENGRADIYNRLFELGATLNVIDNNEETPLHWAARAGQLQACKDLIQAYSKADQDSLPDYLNIENKSNETALFAPAEKGNIEICRLLLENGIDSTIANDAYLTAFGVASDNGLGEEVLEELENLFAEFQPPAIEVEGAENENEIEKDEEELNEIERDEEGEQNFENWLDEDLGSVSPSSTPSASQNNTTNVSNGRAAKDQNAIILE